MNDNNSKPFWSATEGGKIYLNNYYFNEFLMANHFFKNEPNEQSTFNLIQKEGIFLKIKSETNIKGFVLDYIKKHELGEPVWNLMSGNIKFFKRDFLSMLDSKEIKTLKDTKDTAYLFYENGVVEINKDGAKLKTYKSFDLHIWADQVIKRKYIKADHHESEYRLFIWKISGGFDIQDKNCLEEKAKYQSTVERYNTFQTVIGYLLHSFNQRGKNKAIILNDEIISDNPDGQSGKGIFWNAIKHLKNVQALNGKDFDFTDPFPYQSVKTDCQVLVWDDVRKHFDFEQLFSVITEGIEITYKGQNTIKLPIEDSPKILITTNYTIKGSGGSHEARRFEVELSSFFNVNFTPIDLFGHLLFEDWDENEWARFDCYMIECLKKYLDKGLVSYKSISLPYKKLEVSITKELFDFIKETEKNEWILSNEFYTNYQNSISKRFNAKTKTFVTQSVKKYCEFFGLEYESTHSGGVTKFTMKIKGLNSEIVGDIWDTIKN